jgi:hypothetical protein
VTAGLVELELEFELELVVGLELELVDGLELEFVEQPATTRKAAASVSIGCVEQFSTLSDGQQSSKTILNRNFTTR